MTKKDFDKFVKTVENQNQKMTKEEAKKSLQSIGIIDQNGEIREPYKDVFVKAK